ISETESPSTKMAEGDVRSNEEKLIRFLKTGTERNFFLPGKNKSFRYLGNVVCTMMNDGEGLAFIVKVVCKGLKTAKEATPDPAPPVAKLVAYFDAVEYVKHSTDGFAAAMKLEEYELHKEYVPMALLSSKEIWNSLLLNMTVKDVMTSLPALGRRAYLTMPARGTDGDPVVREIRHKGKKQDKGQGEGVNKEETDENKATEKAKRNNPDIYEALHKAFRAAVEKNTPTTGKSYLLALKASSSEFQKGIRGTPSISAIEVMALMATILKKKESSVDLGFFTASLTQMKYPAEMENIIQDIGLMAVPDLTLACDPASPVTWALEKKRKYDVILVMSDGHETEGETSPGSSLVEYRQKMKLPNTKMVICGLASPKLEFATEPGMLDIGGFDATVPKIISEFVTEKLDTFS
ncbi:RO60-like protein, partial [Mya arenaria]